MSLFSTAYPQDRNQAVNIDYPAGAFHQNGGPIVNIKNTTLFSPNAVGDGVTDDTAAFKAMMNYLKGRVDQIRNGGYDGEHGLTIYMPSGTYLVSDTIIHDGSIYRGFSYLRLVGQNRENTTIRLKDYSPGFGAGQQKPVITWTKYWEDYQGNIMWGNQLRNITIDTGTGNPGAVGMAFFGANGCSIDNVTIRSGDGDGHTGLSFPGWSVQGHFTDITVDGFDYGVRLTDKRETNPAFENITLRNQNIVGLATGPALVSVRKLLSRNTVPAIAVDGAGSQTVVVDSRLEGGAPHESAVWTIASTQMDLFMRNVKVQGYGSSVDVDNGSLSFAGDIDEWLSGSVFSIDTDTPAKTMGLPVEEAKIAPWDLAPSDWANPDDYSHLQYDDHRINAALASGKPGIYFPRKFVMQDTNVIMDIPAHVRQMDFMNQNHLIWGRFRVHEDATQPLYLENLGGRPRFTIAAKRDVHARNGGMYVRTTTSEDVSLHLQNISPLQDGYRDDFCPPNLRIYGRNINEENLNATNFKINGGFLWVLGFKLERPQIGFHVVNGGFLEVLGGYQNFAGSGDIGLPVVLNDESNVSYIGSTHMSRTYQEGIWEVKNGVTTKIRNPDFPRRATFHSGNYTVPLYVGYDPNAVPSGGVPTGTVDREYWTGVTGDTIANLTSHADYPNSPMGSDTLESLRAANWSNPAQTSDWADNYGQRIRGYIVAPQTGDYTFWISGDNDCEFWLSTGPDPAQRQRVAYVNGWTNALEWNKFASQKSAPVTLAAGDVYYIEVLHKEGTGGDSLAVGWLKPGQSGASPSEVVPGSALSAYSSGVPDGQPPPPSTLPPGSVAGGVNREYWTGITGETIANLISHADYPNSPMGSDTLDSLRAVNWNNPAQTSDWADNYGQRIRGYIVAPQTGDYTFWISGDNDCEFWLSTGPDPAQRQRVAYVNGWTNALEWNKFASQKSAPVTLTAGDVYYIEVLHKEGTGGDSLAVGWLKPGQSGSSPSEVVPGPVLCSFGGSGGGTVVAEFHETFDSGSAVTSQPDFESVFSVNEISGNKWWYSNTGGTGDSGRIGSPGGQNASVVHRTPIPGFASNGAILQIMDTFIRYRAINEPGFGITWWSFLKPSLSDGSGGLELRLDYIPPVYRTAENPGRFRLLANGTVIGAPSFTSDHWYTWEVKWTLVDAASGTFDITVDLFDLGPAGTGAASHVGTFSGKGVTASGVAGATSLFSGVQGRARDDTGVFRIDNWALGTEQ